MTDQLYRAVKDIDGRMNNLERDLAPLQAEWSSNAQACRGRPSGTPRSPR